MKGLKKIQFSKGKTLSLEDVVQLISILFEMSESISKFLWKMNTATFDLVNFSENKSKTFSFDFVRNVEKRINEVSLQKILFQFEFSFQTSTRTFLITLNPK